MNARERARFDMIKRAADFGLANTADFTTPIPPSATVSPAQLKAANLFIALSSASTGLLSRIAANAATQPSATDESHGSTTNKSVLHDALMLELRGLNRSAAAISYETRNPGVMDGFRMPHSVDALTLAARARMFGLAAAPLTAEFVALGHEPTFVADLEAHIEAFEQADTVQNQGEELQAGAADSFGPLLADALGKVKSLDAIMHNLYRSDAAKLGAWLTASHVERQPKAKKTPTP